MADMLHCYGLQSQKDCQEFTGLLVRKWAACVVCMELFGEDIPSQYTDRDDEIELIHRASKDGFTDEIISEMILFKLKHGGDR